MAYLVVDKDGSEVIFSYPPKRGEEEWLNDPRIDNSDFVILPKGSIKKLIDKELSWDNEPVKIQYNE